MLASGIVGRTLEMLDAGTAPPPTRIESINVETKSIDDVVFSRPGRMMGMNTIPNSRLASKFTSEGIRRRRLLNSRSAFNLMPLEDSDY